MPQLHQHIYTAAAAAAAKLLQSCPTLCDPIDGSPSGSSVPYIYTAAAAAKSLQSCPTLCDPKTAAHQAPSSLGFSRQEHWSGLPFPSPMHESESEVAQSCPTLSDPMDCSLRGSSIHGLFQARVLEWSVIAFSDIYTSMCKIAGGKLLYRTRSSSWCSVMTEGVGWSRERGSRRKRYVYSYG